MREKHTREQRLLLSSVFAENMVISYATYHFCCDFVTTRLVTRTDYKRIKALSLDE
jgi:hypothetical protein